MTRLLPTLLILCILWPACTNGAYGTEVEREYQLKAAYLYNFARFISWPEQSFASGNSNLNICVAGDNPFASVLSGLESKKIEGHTIKVHYLETPNSKSLRSCHLAFYHDPETFRKMLAFKEAAINTVHVSDIEGSADSGGDIEFILLQDKLRFIINNSSMKAKGVQPSASLLELAADIY